MRKYSHYLALLLFVVIAACAKKVEKGFLSDKVYYKTPIEVFQGRNYSTNAIQLAGSTPPFLDAKIVAIRNSLTGERTDELFLKDVEILTWLKPRPAVLNLEIFNATTEIKKVPLTSINPQNGEIKILPNNFGIPLDTPYEFDIELTNISGTKFYPNLFKCIFRRGVAFEFAPGRTWGTLRGRAKVATEVVVIDPDIKFAQDGKTKIRVRFLDKNGMPFNAKNGEIVDFPGRQNLEDGTLGVDTLEDGTLEYEYGGIAPFSNFKAMTYRIPARFLVDPLGNDPNLGKDRTVDLNIEFRIKLWTSPGSYDITVQSPLYARKPNAPPFIYEGRYWATRAGNANKIVIPVTDYSTPNIEYVNDGQSKVRLTIVDKNGVVFNPKNGELTTFKGRPTFANAVGFQYTDTLSNGTIEYDYQNDLAFTSILNEITYGVQGGALKDAEKDVYMAFRFQIYEKGSYNITLVCPVSEHK